MEMAYPWNRPSRRCSENIQAQTTANPGLTNSDAWREYDPKYSQRVAPLISVPRNSVATIRMMAPTMLNTARRRIFRGLKNEIAKMIATAMPKKTNWRRAK